MALRSALVAVESLCMNHELTAHYPADIIEIDFLKFEGVEIGHQL